MAKHHTIELDGLQDWLAQEDSTYASSTRERKQLICEFNGTIKVTVAGKLIWKGTQPLAAVEAYNSITEKYTDPNKDFKV